MVTVVDAANFLHEYNAADALQDRGESLGEDDNRTVTDLLIDQIEFADVIVLNKLDLVSEAQGLEVEAIIKALNPGAVIRKATHGQVPLDSVLNTGLFDYDKASTSAGWIRELEGEYTPETEEYGIAGSFTAQLIPLMRKSSGTTSTTKTIGTASYVLRVSLGCRRPSCGLRMGASGWHQRHAARGYVIGSDPKATLAPARRGIDQNPAGTLDADRTQELVFIGQNMDEAGIRAKLNACLLDAKLQQQIVAPGSICPGVSRIRYERVIVQLKN